MIIEARILFTFYQRIIVDEVAEQYLCMFNTVRWFQQFLLFYNWQVCIHRQGHQTKSTLPRKPLGRVRVGTLTGSVGLFKQKALGQPCRESSPA